MPRTDKPIRVFCSTLTEDARFFASQHYTELLDKNGKHIGYRITGKKYDVTQDIARAIYENDIEFTSVNDPEAS